MIKKICCNLFSFKDSPQTSTSKSMQNPTTTRTTITQNPTTTRTTIMQNPTTTRTTITQNPTTTRTTQTPTTTRTPTAQKVNQKNPSYAGMNQAEVDDLVSKIDKLQQTYWRNERVNQIAVVDTSYLLRKSALPKESQIIVPFQVMLELKHLSKKKLKNFRGVQWSVQWCIKSVLKTLRKTPNVTFQAFETHDMCKHLFKVDKNDKDGHILAAACFMDKCYPFRSITLLSHDNELNMRWNKEYTK